MHVFMYKFISEENFATSRDVNTRKRQAPFTIYSWTIRIMCYVKV